MKSSFREFEIKELSLFDRGIKPETVEKEACKMEHTVSQESFECIKEAYNLHTKSKD